MTVPEILSLADSIRTGNRRALARGITLAESTRPDHRAQANTLLDLLLPHAGNSIRIGITGVPGVGKSTFIETFGSHVISQGHRLAVLAVDPTSRKSGGSILGDKTRMEELARNESAFIRPSPAGETLGGVARRTREALLLCESAGFDVIFVETVGVGQSETAVADMTDMFLLLLLPGGGDELQGLKRGIVEMADMVLVNKDDGDLADAAQRAASEYSGALHLLGAGTPDWPVPVATCSALTGKGIAEAWQWVETFRTTMAPNGQIAARRAAQSREWMWSEIREGLMATLKSSPGVAAHLPELEAEVSAGRITPAAAARGLLEAFLKHE
ncbi:MAG: methylmalonyl Co-A mutase-associated GTPase MeaB [Alphaproteobacteria bacterium]|nr:methylmalonyl Co-A mutase-associated GTPase MeaB [Alphaproteobacteria bacterium]